MDKQLTEAAKKGDLEEVRRLVENGADIRAEDDEAVRWASEKGHLEVVAHLKEVIRAEEHIMEEDDEVPEHLKRHIGGLVKRAVNDDNVELYGRLIHHGVEVDEYAEPKADKSPGVYSMLLNSPERVAQEMSRWLAENPGSEATDYWLQTAA